MRISDWSSDVCSSDLGHVEGYVAELRVRRMGLGLELSGLRADGSEFPVAISLSPVETSEGTLTIAAIRDVTERRHLDREVQDQIGRASCRDRVCQYV